PTSVWTVQDVVRRSSHRQTLRSRASIVTSSWAYARPRAPLWGAVSSPMYVGSSNAWRFSMPILSSLHERGNHGQDNGCLVLHAAWLLDISPRAGQTPAVPVR